MQTVRNVHVEHRDVVRFGWSAGSTGRSGMNGRNGRNGRNGMVVETLAWLSMIGSNSWGSGELLSGRIALAVLLAALVSAAFVKGEPHRTGQETDAPVSTVMMPLRREARVSVVLDGKYGCRAAPGKSAGIEDEVGDAEGL
ncbi:hypothetical protein [Burkholderia sp. RS02]|uniref:hypothetical protein n=1 Tax=unclassified Burkholderia TaxID=2613784 RepID=UPI003218470B